jgi:hypothetical protein
VSASVIEVAEAMYQAGKEGPGPRMPDSLDELNRPTQERYLLLARAAIAATGGPAAPTSVSVPRLVLDLAEELAFKLNHPQQISDRVREVFLAYVQVVGDDLITDEVRKAMTI